jgi:hypothetical protein
MALRARIKTPQVSSCSFSLHRDCSARIGHDLIRWKSDLRTFSCFKHLFFGEAIVLAPVQSLLSSLLPSLKYLAIEFMKSVQRADASFDQVVANLSPEARPSFTIDQLTELKSAFRRVNWKNNHTIDIRLSIPFVKRGFYFVFLAGPERRSRKRLQAEQPLYPYGAIAVMLLVLGLTTAVTVVGYQVLRDTLASSQQNSLQQADFHSAAIPWLSNQEECEQSGRIWQSDQCWEQQHNPNF